MHEPFVILTLMTLGAAAIVGVLQRLNISPILGYIVLGILVGPFEQHIFTDRQQVNTLAEFGIILLLFFIGLEFHLDELRTNLRAFLAGGMMQVGLTTAAAAVALHLAGMPLVPALAVGVMLALSSTALVMKAFEDKRQGDSQRARLSLAILLFQDIVAIVAVAILPLASGAKSSAELHPAARLGLLLVILPLLFVGSRFLLPRMFQRVAASRTPESFSLLSLGVCFSVAIAAQAAGASPALGAFLGGLVLCRTPFASQILADLSTLRNLALGFFFITIGMLVDLKYVAAHIPALLGALVALVFLKVLVTSAALRALRIPAAAAAGVGLALAQVGEFSFVLGQAAENAKLLDTESYKFVLALAVLSMLITPFLVERSAGFGHWIGSRVEKIAHEPPGTEELATPEVSQVRAIVVGYGPVGRTLTRILKDFGIEPTVIDMNIDTVKKLEALGIKAVFGDAGRREILRAAGVENATYLVVTLPDLPGRIPVVATARVMNVGIKILTRARYIAEQAMLEESGASSISYEEAEVAVALAGFLLKEIGAPDPEIQREAQRIRAEIAVRTGFTMAMPAIKK